MVERLDRIFDGMGPLRIATVSILTTALLGAVDVATGYELSFSIFYLLPVALASWYGGRRAAVVACVLAAATWLLADNLAGRPYTHPFIPLWNAAVRLGFFTVTAVLLVSLRRHLTNEQRLARIDPLTGLLNTRSFDEICTRQLELARRHRRPITLGYLDLDDFKQVNDRFGHSEGDLLLRDVGALLAERLRETDAAGRLGGDEFAVLLPDTDRAGAERLFEDLFRRLSELFERQGRGAGVSVGVTVFSVPPADLDAAVALADEVMYEVKRGGKGSLLVREADLRLAG